MLLFSVDVGDTTLVPAALNYTNYADGWDVVVPDGTALRPVPDSPFTRRLEHPHVDEQLFTRSQGGIAIPDGVTRVRVRAHSLTGGFGRREVELDLRGGAGPDYEVVPAETVSATHFGMTNQGPDSSAWHRWAQNVKSSASAKTASGG